LFDQSAPSARFALWEKLERAQPRDFDVEIRAQHVGELELLDNMGYFYGKFAERR
jgi:hypothetical protein